MVLFVSKIQPRAAIMVHGSWKQYRIIVFCMWVVHPLWQLQIEKWMVFYYFDRNYTACTITIYFTCPASEHLVTFALLKPISSNHTHILLSKQLSKRKQNKARTYRSNTNITLRTFSNQTRVSVTRSLEIFKLKFPVSHGWSTWRATTTYTVFWMGLTLFLHHISTSNISIQISSWTVNIRRPMYFHRFFVVVVFRCHQRTWEISLKVFFSPSSFK